MFIYKRVVLIFSVLFISINMLHCAENKEEQTNSKILAKIEKSGNADKAESGISANELVMKAYNYLAHLDKYSFNATILNEDNLDGKMMIYLTHHYNVTVSRPDKLRIDVRGDVDNKDSYFNKGKVSILDTDDNIYAEVNVSKNINDGLDDLIEDYGINIPLTQLIYSNKENDIRDLDKGYYLGTVKVDGSDCYYLAFPGKEWDVHLWIEKGDKPLIRRMIFVDKETKGQPRSIISVKWDISSKIDDKIFDFQAPKDAIKAKIITIDEAKKLKIEDDNKEKDL